MGMKMNKSSFIKELSKKTRYDEKTCILINEIIEKYFIFNKKNKEKLIQDLKNNVNLNEDDAENIYDISIKIIKQEIKNKLKHPFRSQD
jgi:nucleoid DNA-binding protein